MTCLDAPKPSIKSIQKDHQSRMKNLRQKPTKTKPTQRITGDHFDQQKSPPTLEPTAEAMGTSAIRACCETLSQAGAAGSSRRLEARRQKTMKIPQGATNPKRRGEGKYCETHDRNHMEAAGCDVNLRAV